MSKHTKHVNHSHEGGRRGQFERPASRTLISPTALVLGICVLFAAVLGYLVLSGGKVNAQPITEIAAIGTDVSLPMASFADGKARFYRYTTAAGEQLRFLVMKSADGIVRAAFDACDTCWRERKGYHQEGDDMVCNNCSRHFRSTDINVVQGGCNPAPVDRLVSGDRLTLTAAALAAGTVYF